ncbi:hypothetical protein ACFL2V_12155 [Pseudomonadota bacterium]
MKRETVDEGVKRYYEEQQLSGDTLARMKAMAEDNVVALPPTPVQRFFQSRLRFGIAASVFVVAITAAQFTYIFAVPESSLILKVAQEVELNHNKKLAAEYASTNYTELAAVMTKLDFELKAPHEMLGNAYRLIGARYCSIQGQIAAQLKLVDKANKESTLYVTKLNDGLSTLHNKTQLREGLMIQNWKEGDLFFSLASSE